MCCGGMNEPSRGMSNIYSGFPEGGGTRPLLLLQAVMAPVGALGWSWEGLGLLCHLGGLNQVSHKAGRNGILGGIRKIIQF